MENQPQPMTANPSTNQPHYAGGWIRFLAYIIDSIILYIVNQIIVATGISATAAYFVQLTLLLAYFFVLIALKQQTVGMMALKLKVISENGDKANWWVISLLRLFVGGFVCTITLRIGYLIIFWTKKKQGLHDMIAHTYVIREK